MSSSLLFHGPGARLAACEEASKIGRLLAPPFGDEEAGLKVADARAAVDLLYSTPLGDQLGTIVIGPMDGTSVLKSADIFLKSLEEFPEDFVRPILWANDLGGVPPTIRSRCLERWAEVTEVQEGDDEVDSAAWVAVDAALRKDYSTVISSTRMMFKKETKALKFLHAVVECLSSRMQEQQCRVLWDRVREIACKRNPLPIEVLAALLVP